ncbi:hypothetical protein [Thermogemmatispora sp.]|uniref:hypothetical protein n=1 Tax=Thermogemmatispora sp. TaxID=1968838 RepID=UPI001DD5192A|nr:hypothetical protein [Thermogemmatispora sp.]MBX5451017.1 hypothetical protein [Thermogemmatispora sp.]
METPSVPVPYEDREAVIIGDRFTQELARYGWQLQHVRQPYTDPLVLRQPWLSCPNGSRYRERDLYRHLLSTSCRHALRRLLERLPCPYGDLLASSGGLPSGAFLQLLLDQELLLRQETSVVVGPGLACLHNLGHTLEWLVAEWLRLYCLEHYNRLVPVRHSVRLNFPPIPGDLDVLAFLDEGPLLIECKSRARVIEESHFLHFAEQVKLLRPCVAIFLIDTEAPLPSVRVQQCARALREAGLAPLQGSQGFYFTAQCLYLVNTSARLDVRLAEVLADARRRWLQPLLNQAPAASV